MASRIAVIRSGILQQVDTPQQLYDHPNNVFVGGFIGSPAMNFFNGKLDRSNGSLVFDAGAFSVSVPKSKMDKYQGHAGKEVIFGIRPEDIHDPHFVPADIEPSKVETKVEVTELMGNEIFVYMVTGGSDFVGRIDPRTSMSAGGQVEVVFNMDNMHLFEPEGAQVAIT